MSDGRDELIKLWALAPTWTLREGACLANNVTPHLLSEHGFFPRRHPAAERVNRLIEFALRSMRQFKLSTDPTPAVFIAWSENVGFPFDAKWLERIGEPHVDDDWTSTPTPRTPAGPGDPVALPANSPTGVFRVEVEAAYRQRVEEWPENERHPTRDEDVKWMKDNFEVARPRAREIREAFAPTTWHARGAPKSISK